MEHLQIIDELRAYALPEKRETLMYFFKTGKGQYAEGDQFLGVTVPQVRAVARRHRAASLDVASQLLVSEWHEVRLCALFLLEQRFSKADETQQREIVDLYLAHTSYINNWDLVDLSAWKILGTYLLSRPRTLLYRLAQSAQLWEARIAIVSTFAFIRQRQLDDTYALASLLMHHPHDLMHKAVGRQTGCSSALSLRRNAPKGNAPHDASLCHRTFFARRAQAADEKGCLAVSPIDKCSFHGAYLYLKSRISHLLAFAV